MDTQGLGVGAPIEHRYISGGSQNEIYEIRRGDLHGAIRIPPPTAGPDRDEGIVREWRIIEALDGTDVPHTEAIAVCDDPSVLGRTFYLMGFVDGWSPMATTGGVARAVRHRPRGPSRPRLPAGRGHRPAVEGRLAGQGPRRPRPSRRASTSARSTAGPRSSSGSRAASCPASTRRRPGCGPTQPIDFIPGLMHGDYQFANVMYRDGAPAELAAIVDWEMGTVGDPKLDLAWVVQSLARGHERVGRDRRRLRRHDGHALAHRGARALRRRRRAARSTTSTTTSCWPSGSWPSCSSRAYSGPGHADGRTRSGPSCST